MRLIGLTGGIGMGKSTCAELLAKDSVPVIDTDQLARSLTEPGQPALLEIFQAFGSEVSDAHGGLRRGALAEMVFKDSAARQRLEAILHPRIAAAWAAKVGEWRKDGVAVGVVVIPLLFETKAESSFDATVCVACTKATQNERLASRGWSREESQQRIAAQMPIEEKMSKADHVIWSEGSLDVLGSQVRRIFTIEG